MELIITHPFMLPAGLEKGEPVLVAPYGLYELALNNADTEAKKTINLALESYLYHSFVLLDALRSKGYDTVRIIDKEPGFFGDYTTSILEQLGYSIVYEKCTCFYDYVANNLPDTVEYISFRSNPAAPMLPGIAYLDKSTLDVLDSLEIAVELHVTGGVDMGKPYDWATLKHVRQEYYPALLSVLDGIINLENNGLGIATVYTTYDMLSDTGIARFMYYNRHVLTAYGYDVAFSENLQDYLDWVENNLPDTQSRKLFLYKLYQMARGESVIVEPPDPGILDEPPVDTEPDTYMDAGELARILLSQTYVRRTVDDNGYIYVEEEALRPYWLSQQNLLRLHNIAVLFSFTGGWIYVFGYKPVSYRHVPVPTNTYGAYSYTGDLESLVLDKIQDNAIAVGDFTGIPRAFFEKAAGSGKTIYYPGLDDPYDAVVWVAEKLFPPDNKVEEVFLGYNALDLMPFTPYAKTKNIPVLLTPPYDLHPSVLDFLATRDVDRVYLIGSSAAWSELLLDTLGSMGIDYVKVNIRNTYEASLKALYMWIEPEKNIEITVSKPKIIHSVQDITLDISVRIT